MEAVSLNPSLNPLAQAMITWHPSPVSAVAGRELRPHVVRDGETLRACLFRAGIDPHALISVSVDGEAIEVDRWDSFVPKAGQFVAVQAAVAKGGGGGSNPVKIALSIGLSLVAPGLGEMANLALFEAGSSLAFAVSSTVLGGIIGLAGNALIGAMFQPSNSSLSSASGRFADTSSSPTYALTGGSNRLRPYEPLPVVFGRHRLFPDYGAKPYTEYEGEDQYLYQIFNLGLSTCTFEDFRIGETPIGDYSDVQFFWSDATGALPNFPGNVDTTSGGTVTNAGGEILRTSSRDTYQLGVDIEAQLYRVGDRGIEAEICVISVEYRPVGSGTWLPFVQEGVITSWGAAYWSAGGYVSDGGDGMTWYQSTYGSTNAGDHVDGDPTGDGYTWRWRPYAEILSNGDGSALMAPAPQQPYTVVYVSQLTLSNATSKPLRRTLKMSVPVGQYEVRVRKITGDSSSDRNVRNISWSALRSYQTDTASYLGQTRLGVKIRASGQLNGVMQQLSCTATAFCEAWDGSNWVWSATRNPAWWYRDFAKGRFDANGRRLYGAGLPLSQIDQEAIKAWGAFCTAEGLTFDAVLDRPVTSADWLNSIGRCGLGSPSYGSGTLGAVWDARNQPVTAVYSMANILRGTFSVEYITERLADEIICTFINPDKGWQQDQVRVLAPGVTSPERPSTVELLGCTTPAMAGKFANTLGANQVYRRRRITWESDFEGFVSQRGDVVLLSHDLTQWGYSGRIVAVVGSTVTLDRSVPRNGLIEYIGITQPNGTTTIYDVTPGIDGDEVDTLVLAVAPTLQAGQRLVDHRFTFSPLATPGKKVKIVSVQPVSESRVRIVATDEESAIYTARDGTYTSVPPSTLLRDDTPEITSVTMAESLQRAGANIINRLHVTWVHSGGLERTKVRWRIDGGAWTWLPDVLSATSVDIDIPDLGLVEVGLTPINGARAGVAVSASLQVYGKTLPPADVPWFSISNDVLSWGAVADVDLAGYAIRWQPGDSRSWGDAQPLHSGLITDGPYLMSWRPSGPVSLLIKAVDTSGNESQNVAAIVTDLGDPLVANVIVTHDFHALGFPGTKTAGTVEGGSGDLIANADASPMMWSTDAAAMWAVDETTLMWSGATYAAMSYIDGYTVAAADAGAQLTLTHTVAGDSFAVDYRRTGMAPMWSAEPDPMWTDDAALMWISEDWRPWPGAIAAEPITYEWRVSTAAGVTRGRISVLSAQLDVPDILEYFDDVTVGSGGSRLTLTKTYRAIKNVSLTLQHDGGSARTVRTMDKNASLGPLVQCFDSAGTGTAGKIDAVLQGY